MIMAKSRYVTFNESKYHPFQSSILVINQKGNRIELLVTIYMYFYIK